MSRMETTSAELHQNAYKIAWGAFSVASNWMTPDERLFGPKRLHWYIDVLIETGERDPSKIAQTCIGMLREYEQIARSKTRLLKEHDARHA